MPKQDKGRNQDQQETVERGGSRRRSSGSGGRGRTSGARRSSGSHNR